jgi:nucleotide-binding universal stress UspA family protein
MKILIAYDGSECAEAALEDLKNAGLPETAEVKVLSLADVFLPPVNEDIDNTFPMYMPESVQRARELGVHKLKIAATLAKGASKQIAREFPGWNVTHEALADSPAWAIIRTAEKWKSDLIVVGAQGHTVMGGRLILGSVSQRVLYEASCSVRIARSQQRSHGSPLRLLVGVDNSSFSKAAVAAMCQREWPKGSQVRLLAVVDTVMAIAPDASQPQAMKWIEVDDEQNWEQVRQIFRPLADQLQAAGLDAAVMIRRGNPTKELLDEAETWGAHCIFLGPKGTRGIDRLLLGSVSSAVAARAHCSVEVARTSAFKGEE